VEALMPLRLARIGVPLAQTAPEGLAAAGIDPGLLPPASATFREGAVERDDMPPATVDEAAVLGPKAVGGQTSADDVEMPPRESGRVAQHGDGPVVGDSASKDSRRGGDRRELAPQDVFEAYRSYASATGVLPDAEAFAQHLADAYRAGHPVTGQPWPRDEDEQSLRPPTAGLAVADGLVADGSVTDGRERWPVADPSSATSHPFFAHRPTPTSEPVPEQGPAPALHVSSVTPPASAGGAETLPHQGGRGTSDSAQAPLGAASVADTEADTARLPEQQTGDGELTEADRQVQLVAGWLEEAETAGEKLAGAEVARRLNVPARTGLRRLKSAIKYREESQRQTVRAHLCSVSTNP
ncbi:hypothetical protein ACFXEL_38595, partial [Streptomyces sp. NPDC059382]